MRSEPQTSGPTEQQPAADALQRNTEEREEDWVADVKRWYHERARGVDVARRQELLKGLQ